MKINTYKKFHEYYVLAKFYLQAKYFLLSKHKWNYIQRKRLSEILKYAKLHSSYFKTRIEESLISIDNAESCLRTLAPISKTIIQKEKRNIFSDEISQEYINWRNTGGSTGEPLNFPALASPFYSEDICQMMLYQNMGYSLGDIIVSIDGVRIDEKSQSEHIYWKEASNFPYGKVDYSVLYLNEKTIRYYVESLNIIKPKFIRGYPSGVIELCKLIEKHKLKITIKLKGIYLTSEGFTQSDKDYITSILHCPVYGQYGHTECSIFAIQGPHDSNYVCSPLYGYTEVLDENDEHVNIGEIGEITVTGFSIYGMPFIRYRTGDIAIYGGRTEYAETILKQLLGRTSDYIVDLDNNKIYTVGFIFGGHLNAFNYMKAWQIEQNEKGKLLIRIVRSNGYNQAIENEITSFFESNNFHINIEYKDEISKTLRGKQKFLIQNYK